MNDEITKTPSQQDLTTRLHAAFAAESMTAQRYFSFAQAAEIEGMVGLARLFSELAESASCAAQGHLDVLHYTDPMTDLPVGETGLNIASALAACLRESTQTYPDLAALAHASGVADTASWLETLVALKKRHTERLQEALGTLTSPAAAQQSEVSR
ncbi:rubrerythrin family protein [Streptomyces sp. NPDC057555]|uniref:Rubrerythrin n=1 Tax=Streptomyces sp. JCM 9888 TaxID=1570103 RepID=A0A0B5H609_9ACTN|nr:rubrerythrin [Streptomyces sp. JCM 9888]